MAVNTGALISSVITQLNAFTEQVYLPFLQS